jgi:hypothetical protein
LGVPGATALLKAAERSPTMASAMLPRAVMAWLDFATRWPYDGPVPGCPDTHITFSKSEGGLTGSITAHGETYDFLEADAIHLAAAVGVALGWDGVPVSEKLTKSQIEAIGVQLDLLVKATYLAKALPQGHDKPGTPVAPATAGSQKAKGFDAPMAPQKGVKKKPGIFGKMEVEASKRRRLKIKKSQSAVACVICGSAQWDAGDLVLCHCLRELKKSIKSVPVADGYEVEFGNAWGDSDVQVFLDMVQE